MTKIDAEVIPTAQREVTGSMKATNRHLDATGFPRAIVNRLRESQHVVIFTGAGVSAESGIPTFRDRFEGLWAKYNPQDIATPSAFRADPQLVWDWHVQLAETIRKAQPNAGHQAIALLQNCVPKVTVITQNIDSLHQAAGSCNVLELHGNLFRLKSFVDEDELFAGEISPRICPACDGYALPETCDPYADREDMAAISLKAGPVPICPCCSALLRPDIVWFGEPLDSMVLRDAWRAAAGCDALICVGSSLEVEPAASIPWLALEKGALVIEINPEPTPFSNVADVSVNGMAAVVLPNLLRDVWRKEMMGLSSAKLQIERMGKEFHDEGIGYFRTGR